MIYCLSFAKRVFDNFPPPFWRFFALFVQKYPALKSVLYPINKAVLNSHTPLKTSACHEQTRLNFSNHVHLNCVWQAVEIVRNLQFLTNFREKWLKGEISGKGLGCLLCK